MTDSQKWMVLGGSLIFLVLLYSLSTVLMPFFLAAFVAYMTDPIVNKLEKMGFTRTLGVVVVFLLLILLLIILLVLLIPLVESQLVLLYKTIPKVIQWVQNVVLPWIGERFQIDPLHQLHRLLSNASDAGNLPSASDLVGSLFKTLSASGMAIFNFAFNFLLVWVVGFYLLRDWGKLVTGMKSLLPRPMEATVTSLVLQCDEVVSAFFRGQLMVMLALAIIYATGLWLVGLDLALMIGLIAGLVSIVPYLGFIVGIGAALIAALVQFHDFYSLLWVGAVFTVGQVAESSFLTPVFVGDKIGLHPVAVIFAILAGGSIFGFLGVLLALPVAAVVMVLVRYVKHHYVNSYIYVGSAAKKEMEP
jgi:predicted PurR-regulated permease PerM